jgi:hypothetical protein
MSNKTASIVAALMPFIPDRATNHAQAQAFARFMDLAHLPVPTSDLFLKINVNRLLEYRKSADFIAIRDWLGRIDTLSDQDVVHALNDWRRRIGTWLGSVPAQVGRLLTTSAIGLAGNAAGLAASGADFGLGMLLPRSPLIAFVSDHYPKIVRQGGV